MVVPTHEPDATREERDLAVPLRLEDLELWAITPSFFEWLMEESLRGDLRPGHLTRPIQEVEKDLIGTFLTTVLVSGAFGRLTLASELMALRSESFPFDGQWTQIHAYRPHTTADGHTAQRSQWLRFPTPLLTQALLYRLIRFYDVHAATPSSPLHGGARPHRITLRQAEAPLFPARMRHNKRFVSKWIRARYAWFLKQHAVPPATGLGPRPVPAFSLKQFVAACQVWRLSDLPPWAVATLAQHWKSCPSSLKDVRRLFFPDSPFVLPEEEEEEEKEDGQPDPTGRPDPTQTPSPPRSAAEAWGSVLPEPLAEAYGRTVTALRQLTADSSREERLGVRDVAQRSRALLADAAIATTSGGLQNAVACLDWLSALLARRTLSPETIVKYFCKVQLFLFYKFGDTPLTPDLAPEDLLEDLAECLACYDAPESQKALKTAFQSFFSWMAAKGRLAKVNWQAPELRVYRDAAPRRIPLCEDLTALLAEFANRVALGQLTAWEGRILRILAILAFFATLRRRESFRQTLADVEDGAEFLLWVNKSKTSHGLRILPLHLLLPPAYRDEFRAYIQQLRLQFPDIPAEDLPLLPDEQGGFADSARYAGLLWKIMQDVPGYGSLHLLRHSFATRFLVKVVVLLHRLLIDPASPVARQIFADDGELARLSVLLFGPAGPRHGEEAVSRPLYVLSRLLGHGCPEVSLSIYAHAFDWVAYLLLQRPGETGQLLGAPRKLVGVQAANLLLQSPANQHRNGFLTSPTLHTLVQLQRQQLNLWSP